ncbi:hypothetical protein [Methanosarcina mazei]|nr:hypothetical protein [Methanosarcina mazei]
MEIKNGKRERTNKEKILSSLLKGPKTTTQLLIECGYNSNEHKNISKDLKRLKKDELIQYETKKSEKIDDNCKVWSIVPNFENFDNMLKNFSGLLPEMHKSEIVLDTFVIKVTVPWIDSISGKSGVIQKYLEGDEKEYLKEKMRLSQEYFLYTFNKIKDNSQDHTAELAEFIEQLEENSAKEREENNVKIWNTLNKDYQEMGTFYLETVFGFCVYMDILKGQSSEEAKEYLKKIKKGERKLILKPPKF